MALHPHHPQKRKKWTEEEERTLIDKYHSLSSDGTLHRLRTREKKFRPIAAHVTARHHATDPVAFPFQWSWKDVSTKIQNMRHQYLLVKHKILQSPPSDPPTFLWDDADAHWPNFSLYKHVFGDLPLPPKPPEDDGELGLGLGFEYDQSNEEEFDYDEVDRAVAPVLPAPPQTAKRKRRKRSERRAWAFVEMEVERLREREARMEEKEEERIGEWEERLRKRREEEREWEERMEARRSEWRTRMEGIMAQHRLDTEQIQARMLHDQQSIVNQLVGVVAQWGGHGSLGDAALLGNHHNHHHHAYVSQMMHSFQNVNGLVHVENRVGEDSQDDQFIVDG